MGTKIMSHGSTDTPSIYGHVWNMRVQMSKPDAKQTPQFM